MNLPARIITLLAVLTIFYTRFTVYSLTFQFNQAVFNLALSSTIPKVTSLNFRTS